jgi:hypothetical protein
MTASGGAVETFGGWYYAKAIAIDRYAVIPAKERVKNGDGLGRAQKAMPY